MRMQISPKIVTILEQDLVFAGFALERLKSEMKPYEKKYSMKWPEFVDKFDKGELGDDSVWFDWYPLAIGAREWEDTKKEIEKAIRTS